MRWVVTVLVSLGIALPTLAVADTGFYVGLGAGGARTEADWTDTGLTPGPSGIADTVNDVFLQEPVEGSATKGTDVGVTAFVGWRPLEFLAIELGYLDLGDVEDSGCFTFTADEAADEDEIDAGDCKDRLWEQTIETTGWQVSVLGILPLGESWEVFGRLGYFFWDADLEGIDNTSNDLFAQRCPDPPGLPDRPSQAAAAGCQFSFVIPGPNLASFTKGPDRISRSIDGEDLAIGIGATLKATDSISLRGEFEWFDVDFADETWFMSLSAVYTF